MSGRAKAAQLYPIILCGFILKGLWTQLSIGVISEKFVGSIDPEEEPAAHNESDYTEEWGGVA